MYRATRPLMALRRLTVPRGIYRGPLRPGTLDALVHSPPGEAPLPPQFKGAFELTLKLGIALLSYGLPVHRVEESLIRLAHALGYDAEVFVVPSTLIVTFTSSKRQRTRMLRTIPGDIDMERLCALHALVGRMERQELSVEEASTRVDTILSRPRRFSPVWTLVSYGLLAFASARLLNANALDTVIGGLLGCLTGVIALMALRLPTLGRLLPAAAALVVALVAMLGQTIGMVAAPTPLILSALIPLLPGYTFTISMLELATAHVVSGTARMMGGVVTLLQMIFGVALGTQLVPATSAAQRLLPELHLPLWTKSFAPLIGAIGFALMLRVRVGDWLWVLGACSLALAGSQLGGVWVSPAVGAALGAFLVGAASHGFARWRDRPATLLMVPGIFMMVPGTLGFLSVSSLLTADPAGAIESSFQMAMVATGLSTGVILATFAVPPVRPL